MTWLHRFRSALELARFNVQARRLEVDRDVDLMDAIKNAWYRRR